MATLFHWDLPAALDDRGGWLNPDVADWFADYAGVMFRRLDGRVKLWATLNEPWVVTDGGYLHGALAPGHKNRFEAPIASHQLLRSHGKAVQAYRAIGRHQVGLVVNIEPKYPASTTAQDLAATRRAEAYMNRQYLDPVFHGRYPEEMARDLRRGLARMAAAGLRPDPPADRLPRHQLLHPQRRAARRDCVAAEGGAACRQTQATYTETGWEVFPQGLTDTLSWIRKRYGDIPQYVTENGAAFYDPPAARGGPGRRPAAHRLLPRAPARRPRGDPARGRRARLFRLVADGQPRVVARLFQALRPGARQLRDARARRRRTAPRSTPT